jgi:hypothetical protein
MMSVQFVQFVQCMQFAVCAFCALCAFCAVCALCAFCAVCAVGAVCAVYAVFCLCSLLCLCTLCSLCSLCILCSLCSWLVMNMCINVRAGYYELYDFILSVCDQPRGLEVRVSDHWSWGPGFDSRSYHGDFSLTGKIPMVTIVWVV